MCGIAGVAGINDPVSAEKAVKIMVRALARRGPDSQGIEKWREVVFGHRRLAIFDLSEAGRQPMVAKDHSVGVVFNGAIYNYRELRKELIAKGHKFCSKTDTEVLVHGDREWGLDDLVGARIRGMFAFALWDDQLHKLYLVRDRLGVKPLVFAVHNRSIAFASTVRALRVAGYVNDLNESAVVDFLELGFVTDERAIYRGAVKVGAATIVEWSNGRLHKRRYWVPPAPKMPSAWSFPEAVEETERLFSRPLKFGYALMFRLLHC